MPGFIVALALLLLAGAAPAMACGPDSDCAIEGRTYRIRLPEVAAGARVGAILFLHGHGGKAQEIMDDRELAAAVSGLGLALIAPQSAGFGWTMRRGAGEPAADALVEPAYMDRVMADVVARFPVDRGRVMASGMSAGGMVVWYLACHRPEAYAGFAPIAGTFWRPMPGDCRPPPAWLRHIHGTRDMVVPLAGRTVRPQTVQGDVFEAVAMFAAAGRFAEARRAMVDGQDCTIRDNPEGRRLALCLHDGAHDYRVGDIVSAWRELAARRGF